MPLIILIFLFQFSSSAKADTITNSNYSIDIQDIDTNPQPTRKPQILGTKETKKEFTTGPNYTVNSSSDNFSFKLSQKSIDLGILTATNPVIRTSEMTISGPPIGAQVLSYENHPLLSPDNAIIQDASCDNGVCTQTIAAPWQSTLTYGFGYRCDSNLSEVCDQQFTAANTFKQFADDSKNEFPQIVFVSHQNSASTKTKITYKVNISGTQKTGGYYNNITYLAIPNF